MRRQQGFTYIGLIVLVTIIGLVGALTLKADALLRRAAAEEELLETGAAFSAALQSYAAATPRGKPTQPPTLQDLLRDPRFPNARRHLRKIFVDPVTGTAEWGVVYANGEKGVMAVYSLSRAKPLKVGNFDERFAGFANKEHLSDWKFTAAGQGVIQQEQAPTRGTISSRDRPEDFPTPEEKRAAEQESSRAPPRDEEAEQASGAKSDEE